jgi:hypothetical protein
MRFFLPLMACASLVLGHENNSELIFDRFSTAKDGLGLHMHTDLESRYASEGRDSLDGDAIASGTFELSWDAISAGLWYGKSPDQSYDELQLSTAFTWGWKDLEYYVAYTHLRFPHEGGHDHELGAGVSWSGLPAGMTLSLHGYHSVEAAGSFVVSSLSREFDLYDRLQLTPAIVYGINQGYVADGHDGPNHVELRLAGTYSLSSALKLTAHLSYSFALDRDAVRYAEDALLKDFFHIGIGLAYDL